MVEIAHCEEGKNVSLHDNGRVITPTHVTYTQKSHYAAVWDRLRKRYDPDPGRKETKSTKSTNADFELQLHVD